MHARSHLHGGAHANVVALNEISSFLQPLKPAEPVMSNRIAFRTRSEALAAHILPVSGTMIGVCVTLIGLVKLAEVRHGSSHVDEYAAIAAVSFLASALTSYLSIRCSTRIKLSVQIEQLADLIFLCGLIGITVVATLFAYEVI